LQLMQVVRVHKIGIANYQEEEREKMKNKVSIIVMAGLLFLSGCATTNSIPYKASTANVISIQQSLDAQGKKVSLGDVSTADGVEESPNCRLYGPVVVAPGKTLAQYIKDAFQEELFMARVYSPKASTVIKAKIREISFSSVSPAYWKISMDVSSNYSSGYTVSTKYHFDTSWVAGAACENVADAFGPAVQELLKQVVNNPGFSTLAK